MRAPDHVRPAMPRGGSPVRVARLLATSLAALALVAGLFPLESASAATPAPTLAATSEPAPTSEPEAPAATDEPAPDAPGASEVKAPQAASPDPETPTPEQKATPTPPVAKVPMDRDDHRAGADQLAERDKAGDETLDAANPGNVPYPASGSGSGGDASSSRFELVAPKEAFVPAAAVVGFVAGDIISNAVFTNRSTMTAAQIASFIDGKVATCQSGYTCLEEYVETTPTRAADAYCAQYTGGANESAARIISKVSQACGINPQVLLVMLQKEQGLITHTWPSDWRFTIAMGMGCPDTADCDKTYYGFFNQVYGAARQMKIYGSSTYFTWYAPGGTRSIRYHPNSACGSSGVYVKNQATANLYYYTPYQPNAAALAAGFGTGDSCSSYGNRNFYSYFRLWFGSTGTGVTSVADGTMIKAEPHVYLVTGRKKVHITRETLAEYQRVFGAPRTVTAETAESIPNGGQASFFLRNATTGDVSLLQGGQRHHFSSCAQVSAWGGSCGTETVLASAEYTRVPAGAAITGWARRTSGGTIHQISGSTLIPIYNEANVAAITGGAVPYAAVMPAAKAAQYQVTATRWAPGRFIEPAASTRTYLPTWDSRLLYLPTWLYPAEMGLTRARDTGVPSTAYQGYTSGGTLAQFVKCGSTIYLPSRGTLQPVTAAAVAGFPVTTLDARTCGVLELSSAVPQTRVFVQGVGRSDVYVAEAGRWRHIASRGVMEALTGGRWPTVLRLADALIDHLPKGTRITSAVPPSGSVMQVRGTDPVYFTDGAKAWWISSWDIGEEFGIRSRHAVVSSREAIAALTVQTRNRLRPIVSCHDGYYVAAQGRLHRIALAGLGGLPGQGLAAATCGSLPKAAAAISGRLFVKVGTTTYVAEAGRMRALRAGETPASLNGGKTPTVLTWNAGTLAFVQAGSR
ncbi:hypothetical protein B5M43_009170 [Microbacterium sp. MEC084]|uniref:SPOR domain-containing protein n=1 Tax=unclassified Microbacterium TaxID=2609290 RepID=UPI000A7A72FC|nr:MULTISPECIES: hypothetical protein [unclassified Microbacterium]MCD1269008.1 hypothetical protein [Microbacterium sp. MEC084]